MMKMSEEASWIRTVANDELSESAKTAYKEAARVYGADINLIRATGLWPELVEIEAQQLALFVETDTELAPDLKELIGVRVAELHNSDYCRSRYRAGLLGRGWSDEKITHILQDIESDHLNKTERAVLRFADKMTRLSQSMSTEDIDLLRQAGLTDQGILETVAVTAYFNSQTLLANALGVMRPKS